MLKISNWQNKNEAQLKMNNAADDVNVELYAVQKGKTKQAVMILYSSLWIS